MPDAVSLAQRNAQHLAIKNIHILQSDWFSALAGQQFAMIVSNPPYIDEQDPHLQQGDVRFEPLTALVAADSGMADIVHIIEQSRNALVSGGFLLLEHGWQQGEAVRQAFILAGYHDVETCRDYGDNERVTLGRYLWAFTADMAVISSCRLITVVKLMLVNILAWVITTNVLIQH